MLPSVVIPRIRSNRTVRAGDELQRFVLSLHEFVLFGRSTRIPGSGCSSKLLCSPTVCGRRASSATTTGLFNRGSLPRNSTFWRRDRGGVVTGSTLRSSPARTDAAALDRRRRPRSFEAREQRHKVARGVEDVRIDGRLCLKRRELPSTPERIPARREDDTAGGRVRRSQESRMKDRCRVKVLLVRIGIEQRHVHFTPNRAQPRQFSRVGVDCPRPSRALLSR